MKNLQYKHYTVEDFVHDDNFRKWVTSPDEISRYFWESFIKENQEQKKSLLTAKRIVESLSFEEKPIDKSIYQPSLNILKEKISNHTSKNKSSRFILEWWGKVAAILIIPFIVASLYFYFTNTPVDDAKMVQYIVPTGQKSNVILSDGTSVWLNSGSKLTYVLTENNQQRKVHLTGEAYFNVTKDKKRPFLVETNNYTVKVHGTSFNIRAYSGQKQSETILEEGSVSIITRDKKEIKMKPGERFLLDQNNQYKISTIDPDLYLCWKDNILKVNNEELQHLIVRMERWYGVKITVSNFEEVKDCRYTFTIKTESFREMLELMKYVTPFTYTIEGENVVLNYIN